MRSSGLVRRTCTIAATGGAVVALAGTPGHAAPGDGYVRLAHLSPDTPAVDVYLYSAGKKTPRLVLRHVGYGVLSPYQRLGSGAYTVAMRPADAAASTKPVLSAHVRVRGGAAYTVAGLGPYKGIKLDVLDDSADLPAGRAGLRVIAASLKQPEVGVTASGRSLAKGLRLASTTPYRVLPAGSTSVRVTGRGGARASTTLAMRAGTVHTVIVLDGPKGLRLLDLRDSSGSPGTPRGGVDTGLGGLAGAAPGHRASWSGPAALAVLAGTAGIGAAAAVRRRRDA
ncbi:DUF4397 domain-containing protein [Actinomadura rubrisoli]|uniref:DUF4397 domain-containing protein n=1 Tax=Actinomadura rubrisoli TaxID=2530368 RepID=A0A4R5B759_9ACTN|nr:DUF4397 domain-containing protein [Actinomadura rubrisoli]TDD79484.1 DUF4397 domain-containing protein [Actinomadura rubrisoli]